MNEFLTGAADGSLPVSGGSAFADTERTDAVGKDEIAEAVSILQRYKAGKSNLEKRIIANEKWFRQRHWENERDGKIKQTGWLFSAIANKHADFMDNFPEVNVSAREPGDENAAKALTAVIPVVLDRAGWKQTYSDGSYEKIKTGTAVYMVGWDSNASNGLGDVAIRTVDGLNIFWEPGIEDIQDSANVFTVELMSHDAIVSEYPDRPELKELSAPSIDVSRYSFDESIDTSDKSYVINWYRKRKVGDRTVLHYCRFVQDIVLYASENDPALRDRGWYDHGMYPFVFDVFFPDKGTPAGFGLIDISKDTQEDLDEINALMVEGAKRAARVRYFMRDNAAVNAAEFCDLDRDIVHVAGGLDEMNVREIARPDVSAGAVNLQQYKINEMKENTFNRDVNSGGTGGTTTAAGIGALQEAGSKVSRDIISQTYNSFKLICQMIIELIRQFYDTPRYFRIIGEDKLQQYASFDNSELTARPVENEFGVDFGMKEPIFDLNVKVAKSNTWSRAAQNQDIINFYGMGFFNPEQSTQALACLSVLEIDNKDELIDVIKKNGLKEQFNAQFLPLLLNMANVYAPDIGIQAVEAAAAAGLVDPAVMTQTGAPHGGTAAAGQARQGAAPARSAGTDINGGMKQSSAYMDKQTSIARERTAPR